MSHSKLVAEFGKKNVLMLIHNFEKYASVYISKSSEKMTPYAWILWRGCNTGPERLISK